VASKSFNNGLICGSEQHLVVDASVLDELLTALAGHGAFVLDEEQSEAFIASAFNEVGRLHMYFVGQPAAQIAAAVGIEVPESTRLLVFRAPGNQPTGPAATERLAPIVSLYTARDDDEAIAVCRALLAHEGAGHTAVIHTRDERRAARYGAEIDTGRILVNAPATHGFCGVVTGLEPSFTLGCGTFGGNSTTDNVTFRNLVNVKRLAFLRSPF
jgi:acetaldehyde dehydrogenase / alcohol dehydrogenase